MDMTQNQIEQLMDELNEPKFRSKQVYKWLNAAVRPNEMSNLPLQLRDKLGSLPFGGARIYDRFISKKDGTIKYLFELEDGNLVEGVLMRYHHGNTVCISTQVGCKMGCAFCASTLEGCVRSLRCGEMMAFLGEIEKDNAQEPHNGRFITNIVLMGSGEPLDNYENVIAFLKRCTDANALAISPRNISLSTCGLVPKIMSLANDAPHVTLSISLHAPTNTQRNKIMPINKVYPIESVVEAAAHYAVVTKRRVIFEYALIEGQNASRDDAKRLSQLLRGMICHVNLIPLNPVKERQLMGVSKNTAEQFQKWLNDYNISATIRREMGTDIDGACGQLRRRVINELRG